LSLQLRSRRDAIIWIAIDKIFDGGDARTICAQLEIDLIREQAERHMTHVDRLVQLMRETDPSPIPARKAAA
jgi:hypothetical protein